MMAGIPTRRVCLVQPSSENPYESGTSLWPPLGLMSVGATLLRAGHDVAIVDGILEGFDLHVQVSDETCLIGLPPRELADRILATDPDVVGMSLLFVNQIRAAVAVARIIRSEKPDTFLLWGGPIITLNPGRYTRLPEVDGVILGEADLTAPEFLTALSREGLAARLPPGCGVRRPDGVFDLDPNSGRNHEWLTQIKAERNTLS